MTEAEDDNSLSDYEWHEEDEREQLLSSFSFFFFPVNRQKKRVLEMIAGQNKGLTSHKVNLFKR